MTTTRTPGFWADFARTHWETSPAHFPALLAPVLFPLDELFDAVTRMPPERMSGDRYWVSTTGRPASRDEFTTVPLDAHAPVVNDGDFAGFFRRATAEFPDRRIGINLHHLEKASPALWFRFRELVQAINTAVGAYPSDNWDIDTFIGTYKVSPLGIHKDNAGVFVTGLSGRRSYYLWPEDHFRPGDAALRTLDLDELKPHLDQAMRFDLEPGDLLYWPSSHWHLICSDGEPSVVLSVSAYFGKALSAVIGNQVRNLLAGCLGEDNDQDSYEIGSDANEPPAALAKAHRLTMQAAQGGQISDALQQYWIRFLSADGMHALPPDTAARLVTDRPIRVDSRYPIHFMRSAAGGLIVSANGVAITVATRHHAALEAMLQRLNTGTETSLAELIHQHARAPVTAEEVTSLVGLLNQCHAFRSAGDG